MTIAAGVGLGMGETPGSLRKRKAEEQVRGRQGCTIFTCFLTAHTPECMTNFDNSKV